MTAYYTATGNPQAATKGLSASVRAEFLLIQEGFAALTPAGGSSVSIAYKFSTTTAVADPGSGYIRLNAATQNTATALLADLLDSNADDRTGTLNTFDDSTSASKGQIMLVKLGDNTKWLIFDVVSMTSPSGYRNIVVTLIDSSDASPFAQDDDILLGFVRTGDKGSTGGSVFVYAAQAATTALTAADFAFATRKFVDVTSGTAQTSATASVIGADTYVRYRNSTSAVVTFTPGSGTVDGLASLNIWPGAVREIHCDGTNFRTVPMVGGVLKVSTSGAGTFTKTSNVPAYDTRITGGGAGGGGGGGGGSGRGANTNSGSGGSGGSGGAGGQSGQTTRKVIPAAQLPATVSYVIGTGGAGGTAGTGGAGASSGGNGNNGVDGGDGAVGVASTFGASTASYYMTAAGGSTGTNKGIKGTAGSNNNAGGTAVTNAASLTSSSTAINMANSGPTVNGGISVAGTNQTSAAPGTAGGAGGTSSTTFGSLTTDAGAAGGASNAVLGTVGNAGTTPSAPTTPGAGGIGGGGGGGSAGVGAGADAVTGAGGAGGTGGVGAAGELEVIELL